jgi:hypothetical protein
MISTVISVTPDSSCSDIGRDLDVLLADIEARLGVDKRKRATRRASKQIESDLYDTPDDDQTVDEHAVR